MRNRYAQISIADIYADVSVALEENKPEFLRMLEEHINFQQLIPCEFTMAFYSGFGRLREYSLESFVRLCVLQKIMGVPVDSVFLNILRCSQELRDFCGDVSFKHKHPEAVTQKTDNPDLDKEISDSKSLRPVLQDFFNTHKSFSYNTFLGDSAFDSYDTYTMLRKEFHFSRMAIPLNRLSSKNKHSDYDLNGAPVCPVDSTPFTYLGVS